MMRWLTGMLTLAALASAADANAALEAHILGIDGRSALDEGHPIVTALVAVAFPGAVADAVRPCAGLRSAAVILDCWDVSLQKPGALGGWITSPFPSSSARFVLRADGEDRALPFVGATQWKNARGTSRAGTAWIVALDASAPSGARYPEATKAAYMAIQAMAPQDWIDIVIFDDRDIVRDSHWRTFAERNAAVTTLQSQPTPARSHAKPLGLAPLVQSIADQAMAALYARGAANEAPLHRAMILLSSGARGDATLAETARAAFDKGRFGDGTLPKAPLAVVSMWFPTTTADPFSSREAQTMAAFANPALGGFFAVVLPNRVAAVESTFARVHQNFDMMWLTRWRMPCPNDSDTQSFALAFEAIAPHIVPDGTFRDVPLGVSASAWPLEVLADVGEDSRAQTPAFAPGDVVTVKGSFCWSGDPHRVEVYFAANRTASLDDVRARGLRGEVFEVDPTFVRVRVPDGARALVGDAGGVVRVVLYDNVSRRSSSTERGAVTLALRASDPPASTVDAAAAPVPSSAVASMPPPPRPSSRGCACDVAGGGDAGTPRNALVPFGAIALSFARRRRERIRRYTPSP